MHEENGKITLPKGLQREMMEFFLKTSIPRKKREEQEKNRVLSEIENQNSDRSVENGSNENGNICSG